MTVFIVQNPTRKDDSGKIVKVFDFSPAEDYGSTEFLLNASFKPWDLEPAMILLHEKLQAFDDDDYLVFAGHPTFMMIAGAIAAHYNEGNVKTLHWSGKYKKYESIQVTDIFCQLEMEE